MKHQIDTGEGPKRKDTESSGNTPVKSRASTKKYQELGNYIMETTVTKTTITKVRDQIHK